MQRRVNDRGEKLSMGMPSGHVYVLTYQLTFKCSAVLLTAITVSRKLAKVPFS